MEKYEVIKDIEKKQMNANPHGDVEVSFVPKGTILLCAFNTSRCDYIGSEGTYQLHAKDGKYVCDLDSPMAKEHCVKLQESLQVLEVRKKELQVIQRHLSEQLSQVESDIQNIECHINTKTKQLSN